MANASVTTIRMPTKYLALIMKGNGIIMISFSPNNIPNAMRMANTPPEAPIVGVVGSPSTCAYERATVVIAAPTTPTENSSTKRRVPHALSMAEPNIHSPIMFPNQMPEPERAESCR